MFYYSVKLLISATLIVMVSEVAKRSTLFGGLIASLPLVSFLGIIWLYIDTHDVQRVALLATDIFWLVLPSLIFFALFPRLLIHYPFWPALIVSTAIMLLGYGGVLVIANAVRS